MTDQEFFAIMDDIVCSDAPDNDPNVGKDRLLGDLLVKAYEEDLNIHVAGNGIFEVQGRKMGAMISIPLSSSNPDMNVQGVLCYSSPETAKEEPDDLNKFTYSVRELLAFVYVNYQMCAILINYNIDGKFVMIERKNLTKWLTPFVRKELRSKQNYAKKQSKFQGAIRFPSLN